MDESKTVIERWISESEAELNFAVGDIVKFTMNFNTSYYQVIEKWQDGYVGWYKYKYRFIEAGEPNSEYPHCSIRLATISELVILKLKGKI